MVCLKEPPNVGSPSLVGSPKHNGITVDIIDEHEQGILSRLEIVEKQGWKQESPREGGRCGNI